MFHLSSKQKKSWEMSFASRKCSYSITTRFSSEAFYLLSYKLRINMKRFYRCLNIENNLSVGYDTYLSSNLNVSGITKIENSDNVDDFHFKRIEKFGEIENYNFGSFGEQLSSIQKTEINELFETRNQAIARSSKDIGCVILYTSNVYPH